MTKALFHLGQLVATPGALQALADAEQQALAFLKRHQSGDWGDLSSEDKALNSQAVTTGGRIFSAYQTEKSVKIWVITEADRSSTCILLPSEY